MSKISEFHHTDW